MNVPILLTLFSLATHSVFADAPRAVKQDLVSSPITRVYKKTDALPKSVQTSLRTLFKQETLELADPTQPFQETHSLQIEAKPKQLPARRLRFAFETPKHFVVYYESGGMGRAGNALVFSSPGKANPSLVWGGVDFEYLDLAKTPQQLVERVRKNRLVDDKPFIW